MQQRVRKIETGIWSGAIELPVPSAKPTSRMNRHNND
jgi:hypothetical protein